MQDPGNDRIAAGSIRAKYLSGEMATFEHSAKWGASSDLGSNGKCTQRRRKTTASIPEPKSRRGHRILGYPQTVLQNNHLLIRHANYNR